MTAKPQANTLDEIEKMFELGETAKACNMIEALITEARIDEIGKLHDDILMSENHIRALKKARACLTQLKENK